VRQRVREEGSLILSSLVLHSKLKVKICDLLIICFSGDGSIVSIEYAWF